MLNKLDIKSIFILLSKNILYLFLVLAGLFLSLSIWSNWHTSIDSIFGGRSISFVFSNLIFTVLIIVLANFFLARCHSNSWLFEHIKQSILLYMTGIMLILFLPPINEPGPEGGDIGGRMLILAILVAAVINAAFLIFRSMTNRSKV